MKLAKILYLMLSIVVASPVVAQTVEEDVNFDTEAEEFGVDPIEMMGVDANVKFDLYVKAIELITMSDNDVANDAVHFPDYEEQEIFIGDCNDPRFIYGVGSVASDPAYIFAYEYDRLRTIFIQQGLPQNYWAPVLSEFRSLVVSSDLSNGGQITEWVQDADLKYTGNIWDDFVLNLVHNKIAYEVNSRMIGSGRTVFARGEGCGANEEIVELETDPIDGSIFLISNFRKIVCDARGVGSFDFNQCSGWRRIADGSFEDVVGSYYFLVRWPDGRTLHGTIGFDDDRFENLVTFTPSGVRRTMKE